MTFRDVLKEEEMQELVGEVDSVGPRVVTLRTKVGWKIIVMVKMRWMLITKTIQGLSQ